MKKRIPRKLKKKQLTRVSTGTRITDWHRKQSNQWSAETREKLLKHGLSMIYGEPIRPRLTAQQREDLANRVRELDKG